MEGLLLDLNQDGGVVESFHNLLVEKDHHPKRKIYSFNLHPFFARQRAVHYRSVAPCVKEMSVTFGEVHTIFSTVYRFETAPISGCKTCCESCVRSNRVSNTTKQGATLNGNKELSTQLSSLQLPRREVVNLDVVLYVCFPVDTGLER